MIKEMSCFNTASIIRYARKKGMSDESIFKGINSSMEKLLDTSEWTDTATWTRLASNLEEFLGGEPGVLVSAAKEILRTETSSFFLFLFKIAPESFMIHNVTPYATQYSCKILRYKADIVKEGQAAVVSQPTDPAKYSRQMCDYNKGLAIAYMEFKGRKNVCLTETTCVIADHSKECRYTVTWTPQINLISRIKNFFYFRFKNQRQIIQHIESSNESLQKQYKEILELKTDIETTRDFYHHIMENTNEGIVWLNHNHEIVFSNMGFCKIIGLEGAALNGRKISALIADNNFPDQIHDFLLKCFSSPNTPYFDEFTIIASENKTLIIEVTAKWTTSNNQKPGYLLNIRDITETRKIARKLFITENRYQSLYENSPAFIIGMDIEGRILYANPAMREKSGYTGQELLNMNVMELLSTDVEVNPFLAMKENLITETRLMEVHFRNKKNEWITAAFQSYPLYDDTNKLTGISAIGVDITETKRLNEQIVRTQRMDLLGQLAGGMAHDFNNLLMSITGYSHFITKQTEKKLVKDYAGSINKAAERASELTRNLLTFSRGEVDKREKFSLNEMMMEVKQLMLPIVPRSIDIVMDLPETECFIKGDSGKINQCLLNLCLNAKDAIGHEQGTITLRLCENPEKYQAIMEVEDSGHGIPPNIIDRIFDPFFSTKKKGKGTGLGLSVVYGIIRAHQGDITVDSHPGQGTVFRIILPTMVPTDKKRDEDTQEIAALKRSGKIMIVDDESLVRGFCNDILHNNGYATMQFANAEDAVKWFVNNSNEVAIALADIVLPEMDGIEMVDHLREVRRNLNVIFMTGFILPNTRRPPKDDPLLTKPFSPVKLIKTIESTLIKR